MQDNDTESSPDNEQVRNLAYQLWEEEGRPEGRQDEFWFAALRKLGVKHPTPSKPADPDPSDEDRGN